MNPMLMEPTIEPVPCRQCGGEPTLVSLGKGGYSRSAFQVRAECRECGRRAIAERTPSDALEAWNGRNE